MFPATYFFPLPEQPKEDFIFAPFADPLQMPMRQVQTQFHSPPEIHEFKPAAMFGEPTVHYINDASMMSKPLHYVVDSKKNFVQPTNSKKLDARAPVFTQKQSTNSSLRSLLDLIDRLGIVNYKQRSCTGFPYHGLNADCSSDHSSHQSLPSPISRSLPKALPTPSPSLSPEPSTPEISPQLKPQIVKEISEPSTITIAPSPEVEQVHQTENRLMTPESYQSSIKIVEPRKLMTDILGKAKTKKAMITTGTPRIPASESTDDLVEIPTKELLASDVKLGWSKTRVRLCRAFVHDGHCCRGSRCNFIHAKPLRVSRDQIVFLGGLPDCTRMGLFKELLDAGLNVKNLPVVLDRFTPRVVLSSKRAARKLIKQKTIKLFGIDVDVRAYKQSSEVYQIFLGGIPQNTTVQDIRASLENVGCKLANVPTVNKGYVINCEVATKSQQQKLLEQGFLEILGRNCEVKKLTKRKRGIRYKNFE